MSNVRELEVAIGKLHYMELNMVKLTECIRLEGTDFSLDIN